MTAASLSSCGVLQRVAHLVACLTAGAVCLDGGVACQGFVGLEMFAPQGPKRSLGGSAQRSPL